MPGALGAIAIRSNLQTMLEVELPWTPAQAAAIERAYRRVSPFLDGAAP